MYSEHQLNVKMCVDTRRSTTGITIFMYGTLVDWQSQRQRQVQLSTGAAEYVAIGEAVKRAL